MFTSILGFIIILGPLVVVHELGHYLFARLFNVKAEAFSVGFGPKLWARQFGETEFRLSAIPLGGYVKLLGEDLETKLSAAEKKRALHNQAAWKRFFIFFGGPLFNFIFAILVFMAILVIGEPQVASVVGRVVRDSDAAQVGFLANDRIVEVENQKIRRFDEFLNVVRSRPGEEISLTVKREGASEPVKINVTPSVRDGYSMYGESRKIGEIRGLMAQDLGTLIGVADSTLLGGRVGLKTGDHIVAVNDRPVSGWRELEAVYNGITPSAAVVFSIERNQGKEKAKISFVKPTSPKTLRGTLGILPSELYIHQVVKGSPAEKAGLKRGDRIQKVGGKTVHSFMSLKHQVQDLGESKGRVDVTWIREGRSMSSTIIPTATERRDPVLKRVTEYTIGVIPMLAYAPPVTTIYRVLNPFRLVYEGTERMVLFTWRNVVSITKMISGDVSVATLGGPILIGKIAGESLSRGLIAFLTLMATLSVGLGFLNILPIPVLDGGHLMLLTIEMIRGKPLSLRQMELLQQVGLTLIMLLMVVVFTNDIKRLPFFN